MEINNITLDTLKKYNIIILEKINEGMSGTVNKCFLDN